MQCLVMILEMFPETGAVEIICPVKETNLLAERTKPESIILSMVLVILATFLSAISMVPRALSQVIPNQSSLWQGIHTEYCTLENPVQYPIRRQEKQQRKCLDASKVSQEAKEFF